MQNITSIFYFVFIKLYSTIVDMKFNLKLFVLVGVFVGLRDVWGMEKEGENKDDGFIVGKWTIIAVYKTEEGGNVPIIHESFKDKLSKAFVCAGKWEDGGKEVDISSLNNNVYRLFYNMQKKRRYIVCFIFNEGRVGSTKGMFHSCKDLISVDFSCFDTTNVTNMSNMFSGCLALKGLDLSNFDTTSVTDMSSMFYNCSSLTTLNLRNFNTKDVTNMSSMFEGCSVLRKLDLGDFDFSSVNNMRNIFFGCNFAKLYLPKKHAKTRKGCICCGDRYVYINGKAVVEFNPKKVFFVEGE